MQSAVRDFLAKYAFVFALLASIGGIIIAFISATSVQVYQMGKSQFFLFQMLPVTYWIGIVIITIPLLLCIFFLRDKTPPSLIAVCSICLGISMKITFPGPFPNPVTFSNDNAFYMNIIQPWLANGLNFGIAGQYQHDFPLAFLICYGVVKLGVPIATFFRWAPTAFFALDYVVAYLIYLQIFGRKNAVYAGLALFLFTTSTLKYFMSANYCPNLVGATFGLISLYFIIRFYKLGWSVKAVAPAIASIVLLIFSHHLSIVYFDAVTFGMAIVATIFLRKQNPGGTLRLFFIGIFTYTFWFIYGNFMYPNFFSTYVLSPSPQGTIVRFGGLSGFDEFVFILQPLFILTFFLIGVLQFYNIRTFLDIKAKIKTAPRFFVNITKNIRYWSLDASNFLIFFSFSYFLVVLLLLLSFVATNLYSDRVLDVLLFGLYPLSAKTIIDNAKGKSRKAKALIVALLLFIVIISVYRYFREGQRTIIFSGL